MGVYKYYEKLPPWAKGVAVVATIGITGFTIYTIYNKVKAFRKNKDERKDEKEFESEGQVATYPISNYKQFADAIYSARAGNNFLGTVEDTIYAIITKMKNDIDILKLIDAFGMRRKSFSLEDANLGGFLNDELDAKELDKVNSILATNNIKYRF